MYDFIEANAIEQDFHNARKLARVHGRGLNRRVREGEVLERNGLVSVVA